MAAASRTRRGRWVHPARVDHRDRRDHRGHGRSRGRVRQRADLDQSAAHSADSHPARRLSDGTDPGSACQRSGDRARLDERDHAIQRRIRGRSAVAGSDGQGNRQHRSGWQGCDGGHPDGGLHPEAGIGRLHDQRVPRLVLDQDSWAQCLRAAVVVGDRQRHAVLTRRDFGGVDWHPLWFVSVHVRHLNADQYYRRPHVPDQYRSVYSSDRGGTWQSEQRRQ